MTEPQKTTLRPFAYLLTEADEIYAEGEYTTVVVIECVSREHLLTQHLGEPKSDFYLGYVLGPALCEREEVDDGVRITVIFNVPCRKVIQQQGRAKRKLADGHPAPTAEQFERQLQRARIRRTR